MQPESITADEAKAQGYQPVTTAYSAAEVGMMRRQIQSFEQSNIPYALVDANGGIEIWRK